MAKLIGNRSVHELGPGDFQPLIQNEFNACAKEVSQSLELLEVSVLESQDRDSGRKPFSLVFRGLPAESPEQGIHTLSHEQLGELELFLVPIGPDQAGMRYEAIFN